jgi:hypothetical protein
VRQTRKHHLDIAPIGVLVAHQRRQIELAQVRKHLRHGLSGMAAGGEHGDLHRRMARRKAHQVAAGIARSADHADADFGHIHLLAVWNHRA